MESVEFYLTNFYWSWFALIAFTGAFFVRTRHHNYGSLELNEQARHFGNYAAIAIALWLIGHNFENNSIGVAFGWLIVSMIEFAIGAVIMFAFERMK